MEWFKKHVDTCIILGAFGASLLWMNGNEQITVIKTVLFRKEND